MIYAETKEVQLLEIQNVETESRGKKRNPEGRNGTSHEAEADTLKAD